MSDAPLDSITDLAAALIRLPSQGGVDAPGPVLGVAAEWLAANGVPARRLTDATGALVGLHLRCLGAEPGPIVCLDACMDTAPFGDVARWSLAPTSAWQSGGWLWGRGAADSKTGAAILAHVVRDLVRAGAITRGGVDLLLDADEHTGRFGGARAYLRAAARPPDGAVLGYPGNDELIRGSRGFHRVGLEVAGRAGHSGGTDSESVNAIAKLARIVSALEEAPLPDAEPGPFSFGPRVSVTAIEGGEGFSVIPDRAACSIDIRLTPSFGAGEAARWLAAVVERCDRLWPSPQATRIAPLESWPAYLVAEADPLVRAFQDAGRAALARDVPLAVCGPSNIGNLFAAHGIPTICGLGVGARNVHGTDEAALIASIPAAYRGYREGARRFLTA